MLYSSKLVRPSYRKVLLEKDLCFGIKNLESNLSDLKLPALFITWVFNCSTDGSTVFERMLQNQFGILTIFWTPEGPQRFLKWMS